MKILVFTEGTIIMHSAGKNVSREERVKQSKVEGVQKEERNVTYNKGVEPIKVAPGSPYDLETYIPIGNAVNKLTAWEKAGANITYLTSRRIKSEIEIVKKVLKRFKFPGYSNICFRKQGEDYKDVAEKVKPDILIEDDCESIGGKKEMTYTFIKPELKKKIKSIPIKEFGGIDHLPNSLEDLKNYI